MATITSQPAILATGEAKQVLNTLTEAFRKDPVARWLFPNKESFDQTFPRFAKAFAGPAFEDQTAFHTPDFAGVAAWFAPGIHNDGKSVTEILETSVPKARLNDAFAVFEQMDAFHPTEPHCYLPLLGVHPSQQNQGLGSALLHHTLNKCDRTATDAYLESSSSESISLYERHGFRLLGEIQAGSSPTLYPMLRRAH